MFRAGLVVFTGSSALCGLAPSLPALVGGRVVAESRNPDASRLDLPGLVLGGVGLGAVSFALIDGNQRGWGSREILALLALGAAREAVVSAFVTGMHAAYLLAGLALAAGALVALLLRPDAGAAGGPGGAVAAEVTGGEAP